MSRTTPLKASLNLRLHFCCPLHSRLIIVNAANLFRENKITAKFAIPAAFSKTFIKNHWFSIEKSLRVFWRGKKSYSSEQHSWRIINIKKQRQWYFEWTVWWKQLRCGNSTNTTLSTNFNQWIFQSKGSYIIYLNKFISSKIPVFGVFWSLFCRIWTEYGDLLRNFPYSVRMREHMEQKISKYGNFTRLV